MIPQPKRKVQSVVVVGNGPSAAGQGELIDGHDFVVRINRNFAHFPKGDAGAKIDAWAWYGSHKMVKDMPRGDYRMWFTQPTFREKSPERLRRVINVAGDRRVTVVSNDTWVSLKMHITKSVEYVNINPTTGMTALHMALKEFPSVGKITVVGFDATTPDKPGWGDNVPVSTGKNCDGTWNPNAPHDMTAEKRVLQSLHDRGRINWIRLHQQSC